MTLPSASNYWRNVLHPCVCAPSAYLIKYMNTFKALIHLRFMGDVAWKQAVIKQPAQVNPVHHGANTDRLTSKRSHLYLRPI